MGTGNNSASARPQVVIVGGGFGGLTLAQSLKDAPVEVLVADRSNHHLFQPLLYQVAMAGLSPADIAAPIRGILSAQRNTRVVMTTVTGADLAAQTLHTTDGPIAYDYVIFAAGARTSYFGHDGWEANAPGLKSIEDATQIRRRVLSAFEAAEKDPGPVPQDLLTFVVIGGGPTGVELAGAVRELARFVLDQDFRNVQPGSARVILLEASDRILASMHPSMSQAAMDQLKELGVEVVLGERVTGIRPDGVQTDRRFMPARNVMWAAGVEAVPLARTLGAPVDRSGRIQVEPDLSIPGHPRAFCIGDMACFTHDTGKPLPGVSPVAMQQARHVAQLIAADMHGHTRTPFHYVDKGTMATVGRSRAVAQTGALRLRGLVAWLAWLGVHIWYLIGFRNRLVVMLTWAWSYFTFQRGARLITEPHAHVSPEAPAQPASPNDSPPQPGAGP